MKQVKLHFHSSLRKFTNNIAECTIEADSYVNLMKNCFNLFPKLDGMAKQCYHDKKTGLGLLANKSRLVAVEEFWMPPKSELVLVPMISGYGSQYIMIAIMVVIAIAAIATGQIEIIAAEAAVAEGVVGAAEAAVAASELAATLTQLGISLLLSSMAMLMRTILAPKPKKSTKTSERDNLAFTGLQYTNSPTTPIPLVYGEHRMAGQFISATVKTVEHGKTDNILVLDNVF